MKIGVTLPIVIAGIQSERAVDEAVKAGASGVEITTLAICRPWRLRRVVEHANKAFAVEAEAVA